VPQSTQHDGIAQPRKHVGAGNLEEGIDIVRDVAIATSGHRKVGGGPAVVTAAPQAEMHLSPYGVHPSRPKRQ
jgi:hypothetical protein